MATSILSNIRWPRRIILSRKGFDATAGGAPSPIFADASMVSIPIPDRSSGISFASISYCSPFGTTLADVLPSGHNRNDEAHLDPDLRRDSRPRSDGWLPIFGQSGGAQAHLENNEVASAEDDLDLFLFYGYFRALDPGFQERERFREGHVIFGWLQVQKRVPVNDEAREILKWAAEHPHLRQPPSGLVRKELARRKRKGDNNTVYVARDFLSFMPGVTGGGVFLKYDRRLCLTKQPWNRTGRSFWVEEELPFLKARTKHRQEHILPSSVVPRARAWLCKLFAVTRDVCAGGEC